MGKKTNQRPKEGLRAARLFMVLSSMSPLFILWAICGTALLPDGFFIGFCALMVALPNLCLALRLYTARRERDQQAIIVGSSDDHRDHILVYLFAMLLPFYSEDISTWRNLIATIVALAFIIFLFWHLNLHYMNLIFAVFGYRVFTIYPPVDGNTFSGRYPCAFITRRVALSEGERIIAYRLSNTVFIEDVE